MNKQDIISYEAMAKLNLPDFERDWIVEKVNLLEQSFKELSEIDTNGVEPLVTVLDLQNVLREDVAAKMLSRDEILANAPEQYDGFFQVPKTLE